VITRALKVSRIRSLVDNWILFLAFDPTGNFVRTHLFPSVLTQITVADDKKLTPALSPVVNRISGPTGNIVSHLPLYTISESSNRSR
jgi:hypothetical protein